MASLREAIEAADARKTAVFPGTSAQLSDAEGRRLWVGTDIDYEELLAVARGVTLIALGRLLEGELEVTEALQALWADGVLTGLLFAQLRDREATAAVDGGGADG